MPHPANWQAVPGLRGLAVVSLAALAAALLTRQAALLLLSAPLLGVLAAAGRATRPGTLDVDISLPVTRCFEDDEIELTLTLAGPMREVIFDLTTAPGVRLADGNPTQVVAGQRPARARWVLSPAAWGRQSPATIEARCRTGIWQSTLTLPAPQLEVFPHPPPARADLLPPDLLRRIGEHTGRAAGAGIEFHGIRSYLPGDRLRDINWAVSSRLGSLAVNQRAALRAADLVVMVDAFSDVGPPGQSTVDLAVRGAAGLAEAYLRASDRVGMVTLGGMLRWVGPALGTRQFFRIVETAFDVRYTSGIMPDLTRIPRTALPPGALVVLFSPLLDERAVEAITDLRQRGFRLIVVDVLRHEPAARPGQLTDLALRLWRIDREALRASLAGLGVPVLRWDSGDGLDAVLAPLRGRPLPAVRR